jgi:hypothetical protein
MMSEQRGKQVQPRVPAGLDLADTLWASIVENVEEMIQERVPTMATVTGRERGDEKGGNVLLQIDGEEEPRTIGFPRGRGVVIKPGDRAMIMKNRSGQWAVTSVIASGDTDLDERAIANEQLYTDAVDERALKGLSVKRTHIQPNAIGVDEIESNAITTKHIAVGSITTPKLEGGITKGKLDPDVQRTLDNVLDRGQIVDEIQTRTAGLASESYVNNQIDNIKNDISNLKSDVSSLKSDVAKLKNDVSGLEGDVSGISSLKSDVSQLKSQMSSVISSVNNHEKRLDDAGI